MNICFIMYNWEEVEPENDSTIRIIHEAVSRGHQVSISYPNNLTIRNSAAYSFCKVIQNKSIPKNIVSFYKKIEFQEHLLPLNDFEVIFIRINPPLDTIMLNFLDSVHKKTLIVNGLEGLRKASTKLYSAAFSKEFDDIVPVTHVSKNKEYLKRIIRESSKDTMILKPLVGHGGSGVIVLEKNANKNINSLLDFYIDRKHESHYVILQEYVEGAEKGDIRVIMLNGEAIGAMKRIPKDGDLRSNVQVGATVAKHILTPEELHLCKVIGPKLVSDGLLLVGLDIIGNKIIEINVCAPGGIARINKLNNTKLQVKIIDFIEKAVHDISITFAKLTH